MYQPIVKTITRAYDSKLIRAYVTIRFRIINTKILDTILNYFRPENDLLILGCGFGLFDLLAGLKWPNKRIYGVDLSEKRIDLARTAARRLGLKNNTFEVQDLSEKGLHLGAFDEILMLDVLHHLPLDSHNRTLKSCFEILRPGGILVIKDIHRDNRPKLLFTWILDALMTKNEPVFYRDETSLTSELTDIGFAQVIRIRINDILPYPHIQYVCIKAKTE